MSAGERLPGTPVPMHRWDGHGGVTIAGDTWGDHVTLKGLADMSMRNVEVISTARNSDAPVIMEVQSANPIVGAPLRMLHYAERHYDALLEA